MNANMMQAALMQQQQMMMMQSCAMMGAMMQGCPATAQVPGKSEAAAKDSASASSPLESLKRAAEQRRKQKSEKDKKLTTIFVGGLRKSTGEDKVTAHFAKFGQLENVDIKRLPDGTSRGFAFVKFQTKESVEKVIEARASHMIDNKWVAVRPHGGDAFNANSAEKQSVARDPEDFEEPEPDPEAEEARWSETYLTVAAQVGAMKDSNSEALQTTQAMMSGDSSSSQASIPNMMVPSVMPMCMPGVMPGMMGACSPGMIGMPGMMPMMGACMPGMMQPGMAQSGMMQPGTMQFGMMQPGMMQPGMMPLSSAPTGEAGSSMPAAIEGCRTDGGASTSDNSVGSVREKSESVRSKPY